jgi:hypothetical protein
MKAVFSDSWVSNPYSSKMTDDLNFSMSGVKLTKTGSESYCWIKLSHAENSLMHIRLLSLVSNSKNIEVYSSNGASSDSLYVATVKGEAISDTPNLFESTIEKSFSCREVHLKCLSIKAEFPSPAAVVLRVDFFRMILSKPIAVAAALPQHPGVDYKQQLPANATQQPSRTGNNGNLISSVTLAESGRAGGNGDPQSSSSSNQLFDLLMGAKISMMVEMSSLLDEKLSPIVRRLDRIEKELRTLHESHASEKQAATPIIIEEVVATMPLDKPSAAGKDDLSMPTPPLLAAIAQECIDTAVCAANNKKDQCAISIGTDVELQDNDQHR